MIGCNDEIQCSKYNKICIIVLFLDSVFKICIHLYIIIHVYIILTYYY